MITLSNDFHHTTARLRPVDGRISARAWRTAMLRLCGVSMCTCGGVRGEQAFGADVEVQAQPDGTRLVTTRAAS